MILNGFSECNYNNFSYTTTLAIAILRITITNYTKIEEAKWLGTYIASYMHVYMHDITILGMSIR